MEIVTGINDLTPIEEYNGIVFKRDDAYQPFSDLPISGSKVRQHKSLIEHNLKHIQEECDNRVYAALFLSSCQPAVIARVVKDYGIKATIFHGGTTVDSIKKNKISMNAIVNGAEINISLRSGYASVLRGEMIKRRNAGEKFFNMSLEDNATICPEAILWSTANQTKNLPPLDVLYVTIGSGLMSLGVLMGIHTFKIPVRKVVGVNISGGENTLIPNLFREIIGEDMGFEFVQDEISTPYHKRVNLKVNTSFSLDSIYEAKTYKYMLEHYDKTLKNGFWVSGNADPIRDKVYNLKGVLSKEGHNGV